TGRSLKQERPDRIFPCQIPYIGKAPLGPRPLLADGHANSQEQVRRFRRRAQGGQHPLCSPQLFPLARAGLTGVKVRRNMLHVGSIEPTVKIVSKPIPHRTTDRHRASSPRGIPSFAGLASRPLCAGGFNNILNIARPRTSRDFTVPRLTPCISATSS